MKRQAMYYAYKKKFSHLADDFTSHYLILCVKKNELEYQRRDIKLDWAWAEFMRDTFGDQETEVGKAQSEGMRGEINLDSSFNHGRILDLRDERIDFSKLPLDEMTFLKPRELKILKLICVDRLALWEVATELDMSEEWTYQLLKHTLKKSRRFLQASAARL